MTTNACEHTNVFLTGVLAVYLSRKNITNVDVTSTSVLYIDVNVKLSAQVKAACTAMKMIDHDLNIYILLYTYEWTFAHKCLLAVVLKSPLRIIHLRLLSEWLGRWKWIATGKSLLSSLMLFLWLQSLNHSLFMFPRRNLPNHICHTWANKQCHMSHNCSIMVEWRSLFQEFLFFSCI